MIKAAAAAAVLLTATPVLAMTLESSPSRASLAGARFLNAKAPFAFAGPASSLQAAMVGSGLRTDGGMEFSGDSAASYGYLTSAEPADSATRGVERDFEDELPTYRAPGLTVHYARPPEGVAAPQGK
jgi:hypothetical protein